MKVVIIVIIIVAIVGFSLYIHKEKPSVALNDAGTEWPPEVTEKVNRDRALREVIKQEHPKLFSAISELMFKHDPIGINFETNTDEYDAEAGTVIPRLKDAKSEDEAITIVYEEFVKWFGPETAGERSRYIELGKEIWVLWNEKA